MIFVRYVGEQSEQWTPGKIYFAEPSVSSNSDSRRIEGFFLDDDQGKRCTQHYSRRNFLIEPSFCAAFVKSKGNLILCEGQVVVVQRVDEDGFFHIEGDGYWTGKAFEVLDSTNIAVGSWVALPQDDSVVWCRIVDVLGTGNQVRVENSLTGEKTVKHLSELRFPVANGAVAAELLWKCVKRTDGELTEGNLYRPLAENFTEKVVTVKNDAGVVKPYLTERFIPA